MNGLLDYIQTSGNDWGPPIEAMLHERVQADVTPEQYRSRRSVLDDVEHQMARFEAEHETQIAEVRKYYVIANDPHHESYLRSHRTLSQLLLEAVPHLRRHFGTDAVFSLRAPVDASGAQTLYAVVMWPGAASDVRAALANFDNSWWFGIVRQASGNLTFTYELV
jgi:hypothetical protein